MSGFTSIKVPADFADLVRREAARSHRSIAGQLEYWAKIGHAFEAATPIARTRLMEAVEGDLDPATFSPAEVSYFESVLLGDEASVAKLPEGYSYPAVVLHEVLRDLVTMLVAYRSEAIAGEQARPLPDVELIVQLDAEITELHRELSRIGLDDREGMVALLRRHQTEVERRRAGAGG